MKKSKASKHKLPPLPEPDAAQIMVHQLQEVMANITDVEDDIAIAVGEKARLSKEARAQDKLVEELEGKRNGFQAELKMILSGKGELLPFPPSKDAHAADPEQEKKRATIPPPPTIKTIDDLGIKVEDFVTAYHPHLNASGGIDGVPVLTSVVFPKIDGMGDIDPVPYIAIPPGVRAGGAGKQEFRLAPLIDPDTLMAKEGGYQGTLVQIGTDKDMRKYRIGFAKSFIACVAPVEPSGMVQPPLKVTDYLEESLKLQTPPAGVEQQPAGDGEPVTILERGTVDVPPPAESEGAGEPTARDSFDTATGKKKRFKGNAKTKPKAAKKDKPAAKATKKTKKK